MEELIAPIICWLAEIRDHATLEVLTDFWFKGERVALFKLAVVI
jgi:hypothetical protein